MKTCNRCGDTKPPSGFARRSQSSDGLQSHCRDCQRIAARQWKLKNRERYLMQKKGWRDRNKSNRAEYDRAYAKRNPEKAAEKSRRYRARQASAATCPFTADQLDARMSMFAGCWMCRGPKEHIDHVKPLAKGGPHMLANLRPACRSCNTSKQDRWLGVPKP